MNNNYYYKIIILETNIKISENVYYTRNFKFKIDAITNYNISIYVTSKIVNLYLKIKDEVILLINIVLSNIIYVFFNFFILSIYEKYYTYFISTLGQRIFNFKTSNYVHQFRYFSKILLLRIYILCFVLSICLQIYYIKKDK